MRSLTHAGSMPGPRTGGKRICGVGASGQSGPKPRRRDSEFARAGRLARAIIAAAPPAYFDDAKGSGTNLSRCEPAESRSGAVWTAASSRLITVMVVRGLCSPEEWADWHEGHGSVDPARPPRAAKRARRRLVGLAAAERFVRPRPRRRCCRVRSTPSARAWPGTSGISSRPGGRQTSPPRAQRCPTRTAGVTGKRSHL
jgi:hypothetical protein